MCAAQLQVRHLAFSAQRDWLCKPGMVLHYSDYSIVTIPFLLLQVTTLHQAHESHIAHTLPWFLEIVKSGSTATLPSWTYVELCVIIKHYCSLDFLASIVSALQSDTDATCLTCGCTLIHQTKLHLYHRAHVYILHHRFQRMCQSTFYEGIWLWWQSEIAWGMPGKTIRATDLSISKL